ncbi:MAG: hypothetical protein C4527_22000 [Candidatus Omnitrophota bacterium]|nr:MAG: hypothetical protein C4527_22000 [Candidatus Omnitrophota bacterium]
MANQCYLGVDLGAESGRVMAGLFDGKRITVEELHRFPNGPTAIGGTLRWDVLRLWSEIKNGLSVAAQRFGKDIVSVGVDTWGVDYVLLSPHNEIIGQPFHYRDARTRGILDDAFARVPRADIFAETGLQFLELNTLFQLLATQKNTPELLTIADCILLMPDFFHWCLSGSRVCEFTEATTSQCLHPTKKTWAVDLLNRFDLPTHIFPEIVPPGSNLGALLGEVANETGLSQINVVAPASHDTGSAVAAVPTSNTGKPNWAYISSGTWSLVGVEVTTAILSDSAQQCRKTDFARPANAWCAVGYECRPAVLETAVTSRGSLWQRFPIPNLKRVGTVEQVNFAQDVRRLRHAAAVDVGGVDRQRNHAVQGVDQFQDVQRR